MRPNDYRILIIDDDINTRSLLKLLFEKHNYTVLLAPDGDIGVTMAESEQPDVILLDIAMPYRHGMDVYLDLCHHPRTSDIPVLVLSASLSQRDVQTWRGLPNVVDALIKPYDLFALLDQVDAICNGQLAAI